jgi:hypothetical protein
MIPCTIVSDMKERRVLSEPTSGPGKGAAMTGRIKDAARRTIRPCMVTVEMLYSRWVGLLRGMNKRVDVGATKLCLEGWYAGEFEKW